MNDSHDSSSVVSDKISESLVRSFQSLVSSLETPSGISTPSTSESSGIITESENDKVNLKPNKPKKTKKTKISKQEPPIQLSLQTTEIANRVFVHSSMMSSLDFPEILSQIQDLKLHNERLEFIVDFHVNFIISRIITERLPQANEGQLSKLRMSLVNNRRLAQWCAQVGLADTVTKSIQARYQGRLTGEIWKCYADIFESFIGGLIVEDKGKMVNFFKIVRWLDSLAYEEIKKFAKKEFLKVEGSQTLLECFHLPPVDSDSTLV
ncbi:hypothetical protein WICPIJ_004760 [Wickerhamomyces pijperi]|uniref:RNase III domain-containing protein n=1 Tax=Wickerhamomyces pijperi TaxID=599730 RepID=A0A9P8Q707_WICPI|nr:hypothetical protein WICPIJ_004760 [Wickerhamomyces pijperi]